MTELYSVLKSDLVQLGLNLVYGILIIAAGFQLAKFLSKRLAASRLITRVDPGVASFISTSSLLVLRAAVLIVAALVVGIPASALITVLGSAGVAIGLALQGSLSNLAGGLMLLIFRPFTIGDYIQTADGEGTVRQISVFYTTIVTVDNKRIVLPNGTLTNSAVTNFSAEPTRMLNLSFNVAYDSSPAHVRSVLLETAGANEMLLKDPAPAVFMTAHGDSWLTFSLRAWVDSANCKPAEFALLEAVKLAFDREGIRIPYPQMEIHLNQ